MNLLYTVKFTTVYQKKSMRQVQLAGDRYETLARAIFKGKDGSSNLAQLKNWLMPVEFFSSGSHLRQTKIGPCGFFAAIQAFLLVDEMHHEEQVDRNVRLHRVILAIFQRISSGFAFCTDIDTEKKVFTFLVTDSYDQALKYLEESDFLKQFNATLLLTTSYIFASVGMEQLTGVPDLPYIEDDTMSTVALVWLFLNGATSDEALAQVEQTGVGPQKEIGLKVLHTSNPMLIGTWLNPDASLFVCLSHGHFFVIRVLEDGTLARYDSLMKSAPIRADPKELNWTATAPA